MKTTCAKLKKENDELRKRVDELETAVEEILWRLEAGRPVAAPSTEKPKPSTKPLECQDCGQVKCDCNENIWWYYHKRLYERDARFFGGMLRGNAVRMRDETRAADGYVRGPVQRESEPPPKEWSKRPTWPPLLSDER